MFFLRRLVSGAMFALVLLAGCGRFAPHVQREYVYVWMRELYLRDRVAPVNERVARVVNGDRLTVLEHQGRFMRVKTSAGKVGWVEEHEVLDQATYDKFAELAKESAHDPVLSKGILRETYWMHDLPSGTSDRFYLLHPREKLELLERVSEPKPVPSWVALQAGKGGKPVAPELEDFWLARDSAGQVGWIRGGALDEDVPEDIAILVPNEKVIAAYVVRKVSDPEATTPDHEVPEYLAALTPWKSGLPYDFDQIRVFTWNVRRHRYETAYLEHDLEGYLPVKVGEETFGRETDPVFSFTVATGDSAQIDAKTRRAEPGTAATESFRMEGVIVRKISGPASEHRPGRTPEHGAETRKKDQGAVKRTKSAGEMADTDGCAGFKPEIAAKSRDSASERWMRFAAEVESDTCEAFGTAGSRPMVLHKWFTTSYGG